LTKTQEELRSLNEQLEDLVNERTADLSKEILERIHSEERERHINVILRSIRAVNRLIVREKDRRRLIQRACSELVDERGFNGVWIVLTDQLPDRLDAAQKGFQEEAFSEFVNLLKESGIPPCSSQPEIDSGGNTNSNNHRECEDCPLKESHEKATWLSICIEHGGKHYGSMGFSIPPIYDESEEENSLVREIVADIAFALYNIELEEKQNDMVKELSYSEARYKALFDGAVEGILIADIKTKKYKYANPAICRMLGFTEDELKRMYINEIHPKEDRHGVNSDIDIIVKKGKKLVRNLTCQRKDGTIFYADFNTNICMIDGTSCIVAFIADVSEIQNLEQQLQQSQKLEAIGKLSGGLAHDFNNLLTVVIGNSEILLSDISEDHPSREEIKEIKLVGERAAVLIRQLLAFSRKQVIHPNVINLNDTTLDMDKMLRRLIGENIKLKTILAPDLGEIEADEGQIEQVIMNLVVNARDAMPKGGKITIETRNVELDEDYASSHVAVVPGSYVLLSVSDTGIGMRKETIEQAFDPFFSTKETGKGTGLGLSTVYGIVKQSKGYIWIYSEPEKGSTFKAYFPWAEKSISIKKSKDDKAVNLTGSETILLVEDDESVRNFAAKALKGFGYEVLIAADGNEAIRIFENHDQPIHLVLTDVVMPEMSGEEIEERLRTHVERIKFLYMSGYTDNAIVHHGVLDEGKWFLQKPFTSEVLGQKVREVLDT
jgi:PAS domain S-box-containing protein